MNEPNYFWKNFRLGTELQISGTFIYNGLNFIDKLENFHNEEDIFEILYNLSVGLERLEKIVVILMEHDYTTDQKLFEQSLKTHNHSELIKRIRKKDELKIGREHTRFLTLLTDFYNNYRYERFNRESVYHKDYDKYRFINFLSKEMNLKLIQDDYIENSPQIKRFFGKIVGKITTQLYDLVKIYSHKNSTFTYEIRYNSKPFKIFVAKEFTFETENNFKKEIIVSLLTNGLNDEFTDYIKTLKPIRLENCNSSHYIKYLLNSDKNQSYIDEYEYLIDEKEISRNRAKEIEPIGESHYLNEFDDDSFSDNYE